jgi:hypothetical protein
LYILSMPTCLCASSDSDNDVCTDEPGCDTYF